MSRKLAILVSVSLSLTVNGCAYDRGSAPNGRHALVDLEDAVRSTPDAVALPGSAMMVIELPRRVAVIATGAPESWGVGPIEAPAPEDGDESAGYDIGDDDSHVLEDLYVAMQAIDSSALPPELLTLAGTEVSGPGRDGERCRARLGTLRLVRRTCDDYDPQHDEQAVRPSTPEERAEDTWERAGATATLLVAELDGASDGCIDQLLVSPTNAPPLAIYTAVEEPVAPLEGDDDVDADPELDSISLDSMPELARAVRASPRYLQTQAEYRATPESDLYPDYERPEPGERRPAYWDELDHYSSVTRWYDDLGDPELTVVEIQGGEMCGGEGFVGNLFYVADSANVRRPARLDTAPWNFVTGILDLGRDGALDLVQPDEIDLDVGTDHERYFSVEPANPPCPC